VESDEARKSATVAIPGPLASKFYTPKETEQEIRLQLDSFLKLIHLTQSLKKTKSQISVKKLIGKLFRR
jgi:hypothetical protein